MKIKNLKYIFGVVFWLLFFVWNVIIWDCTPDMAGWSRAYPWNGHSSWNCWSIATAWDNRYNNSQDLAGADLFLKLINISWSSCNASTVWDIQTKMQQIWWNCSTCIDWRAWNKMRNSINNCVSKMCTGDLVSPVLNWWGLACSLPDYTLIDHTAFGMTYKCCQEEEVWYEPVSPLITNTNPNWEGGVAHIVVQYQDYEADVDHWDNNMWAFSSSAWTLENLTVNESSLNVTFDVTNIGDDVTSITVGVAPWLITFVWWASSMWWNNSFERNVSVTDPDSSPDPENSEACPNPPDWDWNCASWYQNNAWCCESKCSWDKIYDPSIDNCTGCALGTIPNADNTKCVCNPNAKCCWIQLNTVVPFIWDCIEMGTDSGRWDTTSVTSVTAFPILMQWLMKILMSVIMVFSFIMVIVSWLMMTAWAFKSSSFDKWKTILKNVLISLILLWCSWLILSLINPSFFWG